MKDDLTLPDIDRLSTLAALLLLVFTLARVLELPSLQLELAIFNILIPLTVNTRFVMLLLATIISIVGADWLVQSHPQAPAGKRAVERWILPGLTALGIGSLLTRLSEGWPLWVGLLLTSVLLLAIFTAEYLTISLEDPRRNLAAIGLEALAYVLIFGTSFGFRLVDMRLIFLIPAIFLAGSAVAWRLFRLLHPHLRSLLHASAVGWGFTQLAIGLHYWPLPPVQGSLLLVLSFYLGVAGVGQILQSQMTKSRAAELAFIGVAGSILILLLT